VDIGHSAHVTSAPVRRRRRLTGSDWLALLGFLALCFAVAAISGLVTAAAVEDWYRTIRKPEITPPDAAFGPTWAVLYTMMALAAWRVWLKAGFARGRRPLAFFIAQLALNFAWSILFFGLHLTGVALLDVIVLWFLILVTTALFWPVDRLAGLLLLPYLAWVGFAVVLNASIFILN
jgi:benzodiazapine receptor